MELTDAQKARLPNQLTLLRMVLAAVLFVVLHFYEYRSGRGDGLLIAAIVMFVFGALTDAADGFLARRWDVESRFGRVVDPFADKLLVLGAFVFLCGPGFADRSGGMASGVWPWMVVVILSRELLVTTIRGLSEGGGQAFGANVWGKLKMILQSVTIPVVMLIVLWDPAEHDWLAWPRDILVYATVIATVLSGVPYVRQAMRPA